MAKLASRWAKPDGVFVCPPSAVTTLLHPLDVGELYGVGEKTRELLHRLGLVTVGDLAHTPVPHPAARAVGDHLGRHLHDLAWGVDDRQVVARTSGGYFGVLGGDPDKSMGANETFGHDTDDRAVIVRELLRLTDQVTTRMRVAGVAGRTVTLTVRFADFTTITRSRTLAGGHRRHPGGLPPGRPLLRRARTAAGPDPAGGGPGRGAGAPRHGSSASSFSASATAAGRRPIAPPTGSSDASVPTPSAPRACSGEERSSQFHPPAYRTPTLLHTLA